VCRLQSGNISAPRKIGVAYPVGNGPDPDTYPDLISKEQAGSGLLLTPDPDLLVTFLDSELEPAKISGSDFRSGSASLR
jgi:hypothetical protein